MITISVSFYAGSRPRCHLASRAKLSAHRLVYGTGNTEKRLNINNWWQIYMVANRNSVVLIFNVHSDFLFKKVVWKKVSPGGNCRELLKYQIY